MVQMVANSRFSFDGKTREVNDEFSACERDAHILTTARKARLKDEADQAYITRHLEAGAAANSAGAKREGRRAARPAGVVQEQKGAE